MATDIFANAGSTTIALSKTAPAAGTQESWTAASGATFVDPNGVAPASGLFQMRIQDPAAPSEVMLLTDVGAGSTAWTVIRGVDNTTPVTHASSFTVQGVASAAALEQPPLGGSVVGAYYTTIIGMADPWTVGAGAGLNVLQCTPAWMENGVLDRLAQQHTGAATTGEVARLGLYADNGRGAPGALIVDGGTIDLSTATGIKTVTVAQSVRHGLYWLAFVHQGPTNSAQVLAINGASTTSRLYVPSEVSGGSNLYDSNTAWTQTGITGALPSPFTGTTATVGNAAPVWYRYSS